MKMQALEFGSIFSKNDLTQKERAEISSSLHNEIFRAQGQILFKLKPT